MAYFVLLVGQCPRLNLDYHFSWMDCTKFAGLGLFTFRRLPTGKLSILHSLRGQSDSSNVILVVKYLRIFPLMASGRPNFGLLNARSVKKRGVVISDNISTSNIDFLAITETWLNVTHGDHIIRKLAPLVTPLYTFHGKLVIQEVGRRMVAVWDSSTAIFTVKHLPPMVSPSSFEILDASVRRGSRSFRLFVIYRLPNMGGVQPPLLEISLRSIGRLWRRRLIFGRSFWWSLISTYTLTIRSFLSLLEFLGLVQLVTERTHERSHTLVDLFIARTESSFMTPPWVTNLISDHHLIVSSHSKITRRRPDCLFPSETIDD